MNAPVEGVNKKTKRQKPSSIDIKAYRDNGKVTALIADAYEAMEKANRVKNVDGFLDVYRVAAKKCANLANVRRNDPQLCCVEASLDSFNSNTRTE